MNLRNIIAYFTVLLSCMTAIAGPAGRSPICLRQPDGTAFLASIKGDEFVKIKTTASGEAVMQDSDGWWCYAIYSEDGTKVSSGWKVGHDAPGSILSESSRIPYSRLSEKAMEHRRASNDIMGEPILRKMRKQGQAMTKAGSEAVKKHALVILAEFKDIKFKYSKEDFIKLLTEEEYSVNGATGSAKEYFDDQFKGAMEFEFHVSDIVTLSRERKYYGENDSVGDDKNPAEMISPIATESTNTGIGNGTPYAKRSTNGTIIAFDNIPENNENEIYVSAVNGSNIIELKELLAGGAYDAVLAKNYKKEESRCYINR